MKFVFDTSEEYDLVEGAIRSGIMYWKKVRQDAQGKICLQCNGEKTHYSVEEADENICELLNLLMKVEETPHLEWDGQDYVMTEENPKWYSAMVENNRKYLEKG
jgi:hypothetical protein